MFKKMIIALAAAFIGSCVNKQSAFQKIIAEQMQRYPAMQIEDCYKLVYQAALGNEHLMTDSAMVHDYLIKELAGIDTSSTEPLLEGISPDGEVVRLNLRPFKARQGDHHELFHDMMQTARAFPKSQERFVQYLDDLKKLAAPSGPIPYDASAIEQYFREMRKKGFPAVHHSRQYEERYAPAYRVILKKYMPQ
jgi:hypothetical protein